MNHLLVYGGIFTKLNLNNSTRNIAKTSLCQSPRRRRVFPVQQETQGFGAVISAKQRWWSGDHL